MIVQDPIFLKQISSPAEENEVSSIIEKLEYELNLCNKNGGSGIGLAAIQIGILKRVAIVRVAEYSLNLVNCSITRTYKKITTSEGCLSFPNLSNKKERFEQIIIEDNHLGNVNNFCAYGVVAVCCQHEIDHFNGITIKD
jgi:peptide deformylase